MKARAANSPVFGSVIDAARERSGDSRRRSKPKGGPSPVERVTTLSTQVTNPSRKESAPSASRNEKHTVRYGICPACYGPHFFVEMLNVREEILRRTTANHEVTPVPYLFQVRSHCSGMSSQECMSSRWVHKKTPHPAPSPMPTRSDGQHS